MEAVSEALYQRPLARVGRRGLLLGWGFFRALRLRRLRWIRRGVRQNNDLVREVWKKLCALRDHLSDRASCHADGRLSPRCKTSLGL